MWLFVISHRIWNGFWYKIGNGNGLRFLDYKFLQWIFNLIFLFTFCVSTPQRRPSNIIPFLFYIILWNLQGIPWLSVLLLFVGWLVDWFVWWCYTLNSLPSNWANCRLLTFELWDIFQLSKLLGWRSDGYGDEKGNWWLEFLTVMWCDVLSCDDCDNTFITLTRFLSLSFHYFYNDFDECFMNFLGIYQ